MVLGRHTVAGMPPSLLTPSVHSGTIDELSARQLYDLLRLRVDVFIVEQGCPYAELDGLDLNTGTTHFWIAGDDPNGGSDVFAVLRTLTNDGRRQIGRVATNAAHRGRGYAATLMLAALSALGSGEVTLEAQAHLETWYAGFGFERVGADYVEDGIPHLPMRRRA